MRYCSFIATAFIALLLAAPGPATAASLTALLMSKVGVTQPQAEGGAGSIFKLAKSQMTMENFQKLRTAVPATDKYLQAAPKMLVPGALATTPAAATNVGVTAGAGAATATSQAMANAGGAAATAATNVAASPAGTAAAVTPAAPTTADSLVEKAMHWLDSSDKVGDKLKAAKTLAPAFEKLGMKPATVTKFLPVVIDYVKTSGGKTASKLLTSALGF